MLQLLFHPKFHGAGFLYNEISKKSVNSTRAIFFCSKGYVNSMSQIVKSERNSRVVCLSVCHGQSIQQRTTVQVNKGQEKR